MCYPPKQIALIGGGTRSGELATAILKFKTMKPEKMNDAG